MQEFCGFDVKLVWFVIVLKAVQHLDRVLVVALEKAGSYHAICKCIVLGACF